MTMPMVGKSAGTTDLSKTHFLPRLPGDVCVEILSHMVPAQPVMGEIPDLLALRRLSHEFDLAIRQYPQIVNVHASLCGSRYVGGLTPIAPPVDVTRRMTAFTLDRLDGKKLLKDRDAIDRLAEILQDASSLRYLDLSNLRRFVPRASSSWYATQAERDFTDYLQEHRLPWDRLQNLQTLKLHRARLRGDAWPFYHLPTSGVPAPTLPSARPDAFLLPSLVHLHFEDCSFDVQAISALNQFILSHPSLTHLAIKSPHSVKTSLEPAPEALTYLSSDALSQLKALHVESALRLVYENHFRLFCNSIGREHQSGRATALQELSLLGSIQRPADYDDDNRSSELDATPNVLNALLKRAPHVRALTIGSYWWDDGCFARLQWGHLPLQALALNKAIGASDKAIDGLLIGLRKKLKFLSLAGSSYQGITPLLQRLAVLPQLEVLDLSYSQIGDEWAAQVALGQATHLRVLRLAGTRVTETGLLDSALEDAPVLRDLDISGIALTQQTQVWRKIARIKNLQKLTYIAGWRSEGRSQHFWQTWSKTFSLAEMKSLELFKLRAPLPAGEALVELLQDVGPNFRYLMLHCLLRTEDDFNEAEERYAQSHHRLLCSSSFRGTDLFAQGQAGWPVDGVADAEDLYRE